MIRALTVLLLFLSGCSTDPLIPYAKVGVGHNLESGEYGYDERCALGLYGAGFRQGSWSVEYEHTSCIDQKPELVTNQIRLIKTFEGRSR